MDIRFCDLCNESVPVSDFANGQAFMRSGKVICASCERAMGGGKGGSHQAPSKAQSRTKVHGKAPSASQPKAPSGGSSKPQSKPLAQPGAAAATAGSPPATGGAYADPTLDHPAGRRSRSGAAALFVAVGGLAALGTGGMMLWERIDSVESSVQAAERASTASMDQMRFERESLLAPLQGKIEQATEVAGAAASSVRTETTTEIAALHSRLATAEAQSMELRSVLDKTRQELEAARVEIRAAEKAHEDEVASMQKVVQFHGDSLVELRERIREAGALVASGQIVGGAPGAQAGGPAGASAGNAAPAAAPAARWASLLPDLSNPDEAMRLNAVLELGETGDPGVAEHIVPLLKDTDSFVRMVSVQALGDLGYKPAVPKLIDSLSDDRWTVREAARDSLRTITGKNFGFDPTVREAEMKKKIDQWRSWWRREGDNFLTEE